MSKKISFTKTSTVHSQRHKVFFWHAQKGTLFRLLPPWRKVIVLNRLGGIEDGSEAILRVYFWRIFYWTITFQYVNFKRNEQFGVRQISGPFKFLEYTHRFTDAEHDYTEARDEISYILSWKTKPFKNGIKREVERGFRFRHHVMKHEIEYLSQFPRQQLKIAIVGGSGFLGSRLCSFLLSAGHKVSIVTRKKDRSHDVILWNPEHEILDRDHLEGFDVVVNFAGESLVSSRWSRQKMRKIYTSRIDTTRFLSETLVELKNPPKVFISASAIGFYGSSPDLKTEDDDHGNDYLADVARSWEQAAKIVESKGIRLVTPRIGAVLWPSGGILKSMHIPFLLGLGCTFGKGDNWMSWIAMDDLVTLLHYCMVTESISGPINAVAPNPVTQTEFDTIYAKLLHRPCAFKVPQFLARFLLGKMADNLLFSSQRIISKKLEKTPFKFFYPKLQDALSGVYGLPTLE